MMIGLTIIALGAGLGFLFFWRRKKQGRRAVWAAGCGVVGVIALAAGAYSHVSGRGASSHTSGADVYSFFRRLPRGFRPKKSLLERARKHHPEWAVDASAVLQELVYHRVGAWKLGQYLAAEGIGRRPVFVTFPEQIPERTWGRAVCDLNLLEGLAYGLGIDADDIDRASLPVPRSVLPELAEGEAASIDDWYPAFLTWYTAEVMDRLIAECSPGHDVIVFAVGLPSSPELEKAAYWTRSDRIPIATTPSSIYYLAPFFSRDGLLAALTYYPGAGYSTRPPRSMDEAFEQRFLLLTYENIEEMVQKWPDIFCGGRKALSGPGDYPAAGKKRAR